MQNTKNKTNYIWYLTVLILLGISAIAVLRSLIIGLDIDEQYAVTLAYRLAKGDVLVKEMWEPHQTSALIPALFTKLFLLCTGSSEYLMLYLRAVGCLLQLGVSVAWYRVMSHRYDRKISFLTALIIFHTLPKWIVTPEFANQQIWFLLLLFLCMLEYERTGRRSLCVAAGICMVLEVLAYPSCVLLFPLYIVVLWKIEHGENIEKAQKTGARGTFLFIATCVLCAVSFLIYLLSHMSPAEILLCVQNILSDGEHSTGLGEKFLTYTKELPVILGYLLCYSGLAGIATMIFYGIDKKHSLPNAKTRAYSNFTTLILLIAIGDQVRLWAMGKTANVHPQMHYLILFLLGGAFYHALYKDRTKKHNPNPQSDLKNDKITFLAGWVSSIVAYLSVLLFTNLDMKASLVHLLPGMLCGFLWWWEWQKEQKSPQQKLTNPANRVLWLMILWCIVLMGARTCLVRDTGENSANLFVVKQKVLDSAGKYIYAPYMVGYQLNADYQLVQTYIPDNSCVWYLGNETLVYLMGEQQVCSASTISTPVYDSKYLVYFQMNPDKMPDYVVIDRAYWKEKAADMDPEVKTWIRENFNWMGKQESEFIWILEKK